MKSTFLILLLIILSACCLQKTARRSNNDAPFTFEKRTIHVNFHPHNSIRYKDHLIIQGVNERDAFCFEVYDLKTGKADSTFYQQIAMDSIHGFMIRNERLMVCSTNKKWKVWNKNHWQATQSYSDFFFAQVMKQEYSQMLKFLYEDATYFVYGVSLGEFGGAAFFYHKPSRKTYSFQKNELVDVLKTKEGYELTTSLPHGSGFMSLVTIRDPLKLVLVPDKLNFLRYEFTTRSFRPLYDFWKLNEQRNLSFRLFFKQFATDELAFESEAYEQYHSLLKQDPNIDFKLDTIGMNNLFLCHGSFDFNGKTTYLIQDSILYLGQMEKGKLKRIQDFPEQTKLPYFTTTIDHRKDCDSYSLWFNRGYKDHGLTVRHVWLSVSGTTIYRYNVVRAD
jgi:hypothetical protein